MFQLCPTSESKLTIFFVIQSEMDKSQGHGVVYYSLEVKYDWWSMLRTPEIQIHKYSLVQIKIQVKKEVVASALATSSREASKRHDIEESTIRAWMKKVKDGTLDSSVVSKRAYFQQKYSEQVFLSSEIVILH